MKAALVCWVLLSGVVAAEFALPAWSEDSRKRTSGDDWIPGGALLLVNEGEAPREKTSVKAPTEAEAATDDTAEVIPDHFLDAYFARKPDGFLVDPQALLDPVSARDRRAFLDYHSSDSRIDFYVYLFGAGQQIPGEVRDEEISERFFSEGKPALVLFYYLGAPERAEIFLSAGLTDAVSDLERRRVIKSSVLAAAEKSDAVSQLEAFCVQASIRIYWMEKAAGLLAGEEPVTVTNPAGIAEVVAERSRIDPLRAWFDDFWWDWGAVASVSTAGLLIALGSWVISRHRARYRFPDFEVAPRLGGNHAAGIGAVIGFGSTTQSPSVQQSGVPDYFGGI